MKIAPSLGLGLYLATGCGVTETPPSGTAARVRIAHLSPDAPAVDVCLAAHGATTFAGPVLAGAGGVAGLSYGHVTKYLDVEPGQYDVRIVAPGAANCATALGGLPDITDLPELAVDTATTIAALGTLGHGGAEPFGLKAFGDVTDADSAMAKLRFVHASPGTPNVDVGLGGGALFTAVFPDIAFGTTRAHDHGYVTTPPFADAEVSARATGTTTDAIAVKPVTLPPGAIVTAFAIGQLGNAQAPLRVLVCNDGSVHGLETECALAGAAPERARVRIAHWSPDAPAVDVCISRAGQPFGAPVLAAIGGRQGLAFPQVTNYVELPLDTYDVRVIAATESTCANAAVPDTKGITVTKDLVATVAAIGDFQRSGPAISDPGFRLQIFADEMDVAAGKGKLRFIHASPGTPNVDIGLHSGVNFKLLFGNVEFGFVARHLGVDMLGYLEADPIQAPVSARLTGTTVDAFTIPKVTLPAGAIATAIAIGGKTGGNVPLGVLLCVDNDAGAGLLAKCQPIH